MDDLKKRYSELNDYALIDIVHFESSEYTDEAIKIAISILDVRGLSEPSEEILQEVKKYILAD